MRGQDLIDISEFRNVVGRAGRAYIDVEGLVLYPMFDKQKKRRADWKKLIADQGGRKMESGLLELIIALLSRMTKKLGTREIEKLLEYVAGQAAWEFPLISSETSEDATKERQRWENHLANLDTAIFSLLGESAVSDMEVEVKLDEMLVASLFQRRLDRCEEKIRRLLPAGLRSRVKYIWNNTTTAQRKGYFLAGVGFTTGQILDKHAQELERLLLEANNNVDVNDDKAIAAIESFAEIVFDIAPFKPKKLIDNWKCLLRRWLLGQSIADASSKDNDKEIHFIEQAFVYNLPWAMEAVRVRAEAHENPFADEVKLSEHLRTRAVAISCRRHVDQSWLWLTSWGYSGCHIHWGKF